MKRTPRALIGTTAIAGVILAGTPVAATAAPRQTPAPPPKHGPSSTATPAPSGSSLRPTPPNQRTGGREKTLSDDPDGYVYVWGDAHWDTDNGLWCAWKGDHSYWKYAWNALYGSPGVCKTKNHSFNDVASSMWNNGYPGGYDKVRFFKDSGGYQGPSMCLGNGEGWGDLNLGWERFNDGSFANDEISAHLWVRTC